MNFNIKEKNKNKKIKGVLFDMDGTMFDTETMSIYGWEVTAKKYGITISQDFMIGCMGLVSNAIRDKFYDEYGRNFAYDKFRSDKIKVMKDIIIKDGVPHKKGLVEILKYLNQNGIKCAVATSTSYDRAMFNIERSGVIEYFDEIISGDMVENGKPAPDIYIYAAQKLGLTTDECMVLEDSKNGILSANASGAAAAVLIPDIIPIDDVMIASADYMCDDLNQAIELIKTINNK